LYVGWFRVYGIGEWKRGGGEKTVVCRFVSESAERGARAPRVLIVEAGVMMVEGDSSAAREVFGDRFRIRRVAGGRIEIRPLKDLGGKYLTYGRYVSDLLAGKINEFYAVWVPDTKEFREKQVLK
jgi:hypothetical protein